MPERPTSKPQQIIQGGPRVFVPDVEASAQFFRDKLGFTWDFGDDQYSVVWRDNAAVHFARAEQSPSGVQVFLWVEDVEKYHAEVVEMGVEISVPIGTRPYGIRDFSVDDPNGVRIEIAQDWND